MNLLGELVQLFVLITSKWERLQDHNADFVKLLSLNCGSNECINIWLNLSLGTVKKKKTELIEEMGIERPRGRSLAS